MTISTDLSDKLEDVFKAGSPERRIRILWRAAFVDMQFVPKGAVQRLKRSLTDHALAGVA